MGLARSPRYAGTGYVSALPAVVLTRDLAAVRGLFTGRFKDRIP